MILTIDISLTVGPKAVASGRSGKAGATARRGTAAGARTAKARTPDARTVLAPQIAAWTARGWRVEDNFHPDMLRVFIPKDDPEWKAVMGEEVAAGRIVADLEPLVAWPEFDQADHDAAMFFTQLHCARYISVPIGKDKKAGICHLADFDDARACPRCGAGVVQASPLRIAASELDRCGRMGSLSYMFNNFYVLADDLVRELESAIGEAVPKRAVEATGTRAPKQRWWQLAPEVTLPQSAVELLGGTMVACAERSCRRPFLTNTEEPVYCVNRVMRWKVPKGAPPVVWAPAWTGELVRFDDGRIMGCPQPWQVFLRRDLALALHAAKVHGVEIQPVLMGT